MFTLKQPLTVSEFQTRIQSCLSNERTAGPNTGLVVINWFEQNMQPAGIVLTHAAQDLLDGVVPAPTPAQNLQATRLALKAMREQGITAFLDAHTSVDTMKAYWQLQKAGELTARAFCGIDRFDQGIRR